VPSDGFTEADVIFYARLASQESRDPIDAVIVARAAEDPVVSQRVARYTVSKFYPFDPVRKRTNAVAEDETHAAIHVMKGAPQVVFSLCAHTSDLAGRVQEAVEQYAAKGYRSLGVAMGREEGPYEGPYECVGIIALYDPPREDSAETIRTAEHLQVVVKMVTGDHVAIAREIAREVDLGSDIVPAREFLEAGEEKAEEIVERADGFAEVFPEHKFRIIDLLQKRGHIAGMTGDGVNDVPALKKANVGVAVAGATDAAKSAADIVITSPGLSVIIDALNESRKIFQRMNNYAIYRITETIRVLFFIAFSIIVFGFYPVTALMIVLLALLNDFPIITIAYDNVRYSERPVRWEMRMLLGIATILGLYGVVTSFFLLYIGIEVLHLPLDVLQSFIYLKLSVAGHLALLVARTRGPFWSIAPATPVILAIVLTQLVATIITVYGILLPPIGWPLALLVWGYALVAFLIADVIKVRAYPFLERRFHIS
ncbi:MAG TPA: HAD-IC family P-type ATPase, partial [Methanomicrobiales archaeon]|nr:HAD-IC family P-type ATPase [Methanomicrobiales archaeon]